MGEYSVDLGLESATDVSVSKQRTVDRFIIRIADIAIGLSSLVILAPILPFIALAIRLDSYGTPIFKQNLC